MSSHFDYTTLGTRPNLLEEAKAFDKGQSTPIAKSETKATLEDVANLQADATRIRDWILENGFPSELVEDYDRQKGRERVFWEDPIFLIEADRRPPYYGRFDDDSYGDFLWFKPALRSHEIDFNLGHDGRYELVITYTRSYFGENHARYRSGRKPSIDPETQIPIITKPEYLIVSQYMKRFIEERIEKSKYHTKESDVAQC